MPILFLSDEDTFWVRLPAKTSGDQNQQRETTRGATRVRTSWRQVFDELQYHFGWIKLTQINRMGESVSSS